MERNKEYIREEFHCLVKDFKEFVADPLLGKSANDILEYLFIIFGGFFMFLTILLPVNILGIILACTGYYTWLNKKQEAMHGLSY